MFYVNACMIINQFENVVCSLDSIDLTLYINTSDMLKNFQNLVAGSIQYLCKCNWLSNFHSYVISYFYKIKITLKLRIRKIRIRWATTLLKLSTIQASKLFFTFYSYSRSSIKNIVLKVIFGCMNQIDFCNLCLLLICTSSCHHFFKNYFMSIFKFG